MKKIKYLLLTLAMLIIIPFNTQAASKEPINVHIFRGEGCGYCAAALEFFDSIEDEYGQYFNLVEHEVWNDTDNATLMTEVASYFGETVNGVPYIVIGEKTFQGYTESYNEEIKTAIKNSYESGNFVDVVEQVQGGATSGTKSSKNDKDSNTTSIIIIGAALVGFAALVYFARDTKDEDEEIIEEVKEEKVIVEEPKKVVSKTTSKNTTTKKSTPAAKSTSTAAKKTTTTTKKTTSSNVKKSNTTKKTTTPKKTTTAKKTTTTKK